MGEDFEPGIRHIAGLDHERLSFYHVDIEPGPNDVHGKVIREIPSDT